MSEDRTAKIKALQLTLDKLDKTYGKGTVMKLGDEVVVETCKHPNNKCYASYHYK